MDAVARCAVDRANIAGRRFGRVVGKQALDSITGIWTQEENGAPSPYVCHLHDPDGRPFSSGGAPLRIDADQKFLAGGPADPSELERPATTGWQSTRSCRLPEQGAPCRQCHPGQGRDNDREHSDRDEQTLQHDFLLLTGWPYIRSGAAVP